MREKSGKTAQGESRISKKKRRQARDHVDVGLLAHAPVVAEVVIMVATMKIAVIAVMVVVMVVLPAFAPRARDRHRMAGTTGPAKPALRAA